MKIKLLLIIVAFSFLYSCKNANYVSFHNVPQEAQLYIPVFIDFDIKDTFENPFNRNEVSVDAIIIDEKADTLTLPCFWYTGADGNPNWQARYTPRQTGLKKVTVKVSNNSKNQYSETFELNVGPSAEKGHLTLNADNPYFMIADNGEKIRGLGMNVGWEFEPKWDSHQKYTYETFFDTLSKVGANYARIWICPWNMPIEWTPVKNYAIYFEDFKNTDLMFSKSKGFTISEGLSPVCQADENQLIKTSNEEEHIIYKIDTLQAIKTMLYFNEKIDREQITVYCSNDNSTYTEIPIAWSDDWGSAQGWKRVFFYNTNEIPSSTNYVKIEMGQGITKENTKFAGIQFKHGEAISQLDCDGLSRFSVANSLRFDSLISLSESKGMYLMIAFQYHGIFNPIMDSWGANDEWQRNPYNVKNGGPCEKPEDFFSNKEAMDAYKNYLRYIVARWGYSHAVTVWELWNEIFIFPNQIEWFREMTDYLSSIDPYRHTITTSMMGYQAEVWELPNMHLTSSHRYEPTDMFVEKTHNFINQYNKPHNIGEYAVDWKGPGNGYSDKDYEDHFRYGMWRGLMTPVAILPLSWWWDYHLENGHFPYFKPLSMAIEEMKNTNGIFSKLVLDKPSVCEVAGLTSGDLSILWVLNKSNEASSNLLFPVNETGNYVLRSLNTKTGEWNSSEIIETSKDHLEISIKWNDQQDVALFINKQ